MGQYYKPVSIEKKEHVYSHSYDNGLKLMEHSYIGNQFMRAVEALLVVGGAWYGDHIVWAGDYADPEPGITDPEDPNRELNLYHICETEIKPTPLKESHRYVINMDTKEFVDTKKVPISDIWRDEDGKEYPFIIHPLSILTCEGNGRGGGDLHKESDLVGKWARQRVAVTSRKPKDYKEIRFNIYEGKKPMKLTPKPKAVKV
jgi:hypothetical protein